MLRTRSGPVPALLWAALALACSEPIQPGDLVGEYALRSVAGDPLPAVLYTNDHVVVRVLAETLRITSDRGGTFVTARESEPLTGEASPSPIQWESEFSFDVVDDRIEVAFVCPPNALCVAAPHLVLRRSGDGLRADFALGARVPLIYARVPLGILPIHRGS